MPYMYILKVKKFWVCAYLRLDSIKENIEGDANLHHPPRNRVNYPTRLYLNSTNICLDIPSLRAAKMELSIRELAYLDYESFWAARRFLRVVPMLMLINSICLIIGIPNSLDLFWDGLIRDCLLMCRSICSALILPRATPGTSLFVLLPLCPHHHIFVLPRPI